MAGMALNQKKKQLQGAQQGQQASAQQQAAQAAQTRQQAQQMPAAQQQAAMQLAQQQYAAARDAQQQQLQYQPMQQSQPDAVRQYREMLASQTLGTGQQTPNPRPNQVLRQLRDGQQTPNMKQNQVLRDFPDDAQPAQQAESPALTAAKQYLSSMTGGGAAVPETGAYQSKWDPQIRSLYDQIVNREKFQYDVNKDPLFAQYRTQYQQAGRQAMEDTQGRAAALAGGYGSSWGQTAGYQAYQNYLQQLNDKIPELEERAHSRYTAEGQELRENLGLAQSMEQMDYTRYRDSVQDALQRAQLAQQAQQAERSYALQMAQMEQSGRQYDTDLAFKYAQLAQQGELEGRKLDQSADQYGSDLAFRYAQLGQQGDIAYAQMSQSDRQHAAQLAYQYDALDQSGKIDWAKLAQSGDQAAQQLAYKYAALAQSGALQREGWDREDARTEKSQNYDWQKYLTGLEYQTGEREATQAYQTGEREATQAYQTGRDATQHGYDLDTLGRQQAFTTSERLASQAYDQPYRDAELEMKRDQLKMQQEEHGLTMEKGQFELEQAKKKAAGSSSGGGQDQKKTEDTTTSPSTIYRDVMKGITADEKQSGWVPSGSGKGLYDAQGVATGPVAAGVTQVKGGYMAAGYPYVFESADKAKAFAKMKEDEKKKSGGK